MTQMYKKIGRRYIKVSPSNNRLRLPIDGIWLVQTKSGTKSSKCILKIGDLPALYPYANLIMQEDDIANILITSQGKTALEIAREIILYLVKMHN